MRENVCMSLFINILENTIPPKISTVTVKFDHHLSRRFPKQFIPICRHPLIAPPSQPPGARQRHHPGERPAVGQASNKFDSRSFPVPGAPRLIEKTKCSQTADRFQIGLKANRLRLFKVQEAQHNRSPALVRPALDPLSGRLAQPAVGVVNDGGRHRLPVADAIIDVRLSSAGGSRTAPTDRSSLSLSTLSTTPGSPPISATGISHRRQRPAPSSQWPAQIAPVPRG